MTFLVIGHFGSLGVLGGAKEANLAIFSSFGVGSVGQNWVQSSRKKYHIIINNNKKKKKNQWTKNYQLFALR